MIAQLDRDYLRAGLGPVAARLASYILFEGRPLTTRGRWINPFVFAFLRTLRHASWLREPRQPIYIVGTGRTGTTVLGKILSLHPDIGFLNEPKAMWHVIHAGEDLIGNYTRDAARYWLEADDATAERIQTAQRLFGAYLSLVRARRLVDKYPELLFRIPFVRALFPDALFILPIRDGWDTARSVAAWSRRLGGVQSGEVHDWWGVDDRKWRLLVEEVAARHPILAERTEQLRTLDDHVSRAATEWALTMWEGRRQRQKLCSEIVQVRYEDLVASPERTLRSLLEFLNLSPHPRLFAYAAQTLRPVARKPPIDLSNLIDDVFQEEMETLGYGR